MAWQRVKIEVPEDLSKAEREEIGEEFVNKMVENAINGEGVRANGDKFRRKSFPAYTADYEKVKGQSNVDLTLSGEMLSALKVISHKKGVVMVGFDNGSEANAKAEGNILGSYGREPNIRKARNFLGLIPSEVRAIVNSVKRK